MNCQDIVRILNDGRISTLSASERDEGEAHALSCRHCARRWLAHTRLADLPIPPMPRELAAQIPTLVAARARGNVLRFVSRQMMVVAGGFVVLAAAAAVATVKYGFLVGHRDVAAIPAEVVAPAQAAAPGTPLSPEPSVIQPALPVVAQSSLQPLPSIPVSQPATIQQVSQGESDVNKPASIAATIAAMGVAAAAPAQTPAQAPASTQLKGAERIMALNDLNKDGIITPAEAKQANQPLQFMWDLYDADHDGKINFAEVSVFTDKVELGTAQVGPS